VLVAALVVLAVVLVAALVVLAVVLVAAGLLVVARRRTSSPSPATVADAARTVAEAPTGEAPISALEPAGIGSRVRALFRRGASTETWTGLEELLVKADVGPRGASDLVARVRTDYRPGDDPADLLRDEIVAVLGPDEDLALPPGRLAVVLVVGVNGSGKTTTIGKLAGRLIGEGKVVSLAASDTFRAAAGEQLDVWAQRAGAQLIAQDRGADPGAVAFDAVRSAMARGSHVLIVDTAGRLHTKTPLMEELKKMKRVIAKAGGEVDETLLVLDATTGQNGIAQARAFTDAVDVTGVILAKFDGSARGGIVLAVREELGVPVRFVGVGEGIDDLRAFDAREFAERLLGAG
jgi:fused signal recognition particle receptor